MVSGINLEVVIYRIFEKLIKKTSRKIWGAIPKDIMFDEFLEFF